MIQTTQNGLRLIKVRFDMSVKSTLNDFLLQMLRSSVEITSCVGIY